MEANRIKMYLFSGCQRFLTEENVILYALEI